jgi:hypothetical protein
VSKSLNVITWANRNVTSQSNLNHIFVPTLLEGIVSSSHIWALCCCTLPTMIICSIHEKNELILWELSSVQMKVERYIKHTLN